MTAAPVFQMDHYFRAVPESWIAAHLAQLDEATLLPVARVLPRHLQSGQGHVLRAEAVWSLPQNVWIFGLMMIRRRSAAHGHFDAKWIAESSSGLFGIVQIPPGQGLAWLHGETTTARRLAGRLRRHLETHFKWIPESLPLAWSHVAFDDLPDRSVALSKPKTKEG